MKRSTDKLPRSQIHEKLSKITDLCPDMSYFNELYSKELTIDDALARKSYIYGHELENRGFKMELMKIRVTTNFSYEPDTIITPIIGGNSTNEPSNSNNTLDTNYQINNQPTDSTPNTWYLSIKNMGSSLGDITTQNQSDVNKLDFFNAIYVFLDEEQSLTQATMYVKDKHNTSPPIISCNALYSPEDGFIAKFPLTDDPLINYKIICYLNESSMRYKVNAGLANIIGCYAGSIPRILYSFYSYINTNSLCDGDSCMVICNDELKKLFVIEQFHFKDILGMLQKFLEAPEPFTIKNSLPNPLHFQNNPSDNPTQTTMPESYCYEEYLPIEMPTCYNYHLKRFSDIFGPTPTIDDVVSSFETNVTDDYREKKVSKITELNDEINEMINECLQISDKIDQLNRFVESPQLERR